MGLGNTESCKELFPVAWQTFAFDWHLFLRSDLESIHRRVCIVWSVTEMLQDLALVMNPEV